MAKKFGKFILATAAIGTAAACAYYYLQKKDSVLVTPEETDEDFDDFNDAAAPNYVSLTPQNAPAEEAPEVISEPADSLFAETTQEDEVPEQSPVVEQVEEFFNDNEAN